MEMDVRTGKLKMAMMWVAVGLLGLISLAGILSIGIFTLPVAAAAAILLLTRPDRLRAVAIMLCALAIGPLLVAWFNREGPGEVCRNFPPDGLACGNQLNPWPWLIGALVSLALAAALFRQTTRRDAAAGARQGPGVTTGDDRPGGNVR